MNKVELEKLKGFEARENTESLYKAVKDNPKDKIELELGDSKDSVVLQPQAKVMRWDNEVNLSVRFQDDDKGAKSVKVEGDVLRWVGDKKEVHIYEKPEIAEDGGLEIEILLKEKPISNVIEFSIETKGLDFFYQPKESDNSRVEISSESVKGSYAVYHSSKRDNFPDKEYKTGKFCHIYRPKVVDAKGKEVWGELNVDENKGVLSITIDQKFLDTAVYPVLVDPTFGYTSIATWGGYTTNENEARGGEFSCSGSGSVDKITAYVDEATGLDVANGKGFITASSFGAILTNGVSSANSIPQNFAWTDFTYSTKPSVTATNYCLCVVFDDKCVVKCDSTGGTSNADNTNSYSSPEPLNGTSGTYLFSIYATYTEAGTEANSERGLWIEGKDTSSSERSLYLEGYNTSSSERGLYTEGKILVNSERGLYLEGYDTSNSERPLYIQGYLTNSSERGIYLEGDVDSVYSRESAGSLGTDDTNLTNIFSEQDYTDVGTDDDVFVGLEGESEYNQFLFKVYNSNASAEQFTITWKGKSTEAPSSSTVYLQIYNRTLEEWETIDSDNSTAEDTEFTLTGTKSSSLSDYYDGDYIISCRVYQ